MPKVNHVKSARKDNPDHNIKKGDSYYWWQLRTGPSSSVKRYSKTPPRQSQLTTSEFLGTVYELQERIEDQACTSKEDFDAFKEELTGDIENLRDETEGKLDNLPDSLKEAPTGELLQNRIDALQEWQDEIDNIECDDYDEEELKEEVRAEHQDDSDWDEEGEIDDEVQAKIQEKVDEALQSLRDCTCNCE